MIEFAGGVVVGALGVFVFLFVLDWYEQERIIRESKGDDDDWDD